MRKMTLSETCYKQHQAQVFKSQLSDKYSKQLEDTIVKTEEDEEALSVSDDEEWNLPAEFADMLTTVTELLDNSANIKRLKQFLKFFCHPRTRKRYIDIKLYEHCSTPGEIIEVLHPQYINFMHTPLLRQIVKKFGDEQSQTLLKQYEDNFPRKKPLKQMCDPLTFEEIEKCHESKRMKIVYDSNTDVDNTTIADVEKVQQAISRNTEIDESVIVYVNQTEGSVIFTFLIPEIVVSAFWDLDEDSQRDLANHGVLRIEMNDLVIDLHSSQAETKSNDLGLCL